MTAEESEFFEKSLQKMQVIDSDKVESCDFHVGTTTPQPESGPQFVSNCSQCNCPVWVTEQRPGLDKICVACAIKLEQSKRGTANYCTSQTLEQIRTSMFNHRTRN